MDFPLIVLILLSPLLAAGEVLLYSTFHERSHWIVGRIWTKKMEIKRLHGIFPHRVDFEDLCDLPQYAVRLIGIAPFVSGAVLTSLVYSLDLPLTSKVVLGIPFVASLVPSPGDIMAITRPNLFKIYVDKDLSKSHIEILKIVLSGQFE